MIRYILRPSVNYTLTQQPSMLVAIPATDNREEALRPQGELGVTG